MLSTEVNGQATFHADRCVSEIISQIRDGTLRPSQRLGEASFARKMGLNRQTVRTAFERLVMMGMLKRLHRSGTFVSHLGLEQYCELMDVRALLEGQAASLVSQFASDPNLRELAQIAEKLDKLKARLGPPQEGAIPIELQQLEREFHSRVAHLCGNRLLERLISMQDLVACTFRVAKALRITGQSEGSIPSHKQLVEAMASRNPERAAQTMRDHILRSKEMNVTSLTGVANGNSAAPSCS